MSNKPEKKKSRGSNKLSYVTVIVGIALALVPVIKTLIAEGDHKYLKYILPNFLLFTGYRNLTKSLWDEHLVIDTNILYEPVHIPVIEAKNYNYESLKRATQNFRYPAVVRGMFADTPAAKNWDKQGYLASKIGKHIIPVVNDATYGTLQNNRSSLSFAEAYGEILSDEASKMYLFFPVKSRFNFNGTDLKAIDDLQDGVNKVVDEDLDLSRIWRGFGSKNHTSYLGSQLIIGRGTNDTDATTGTGWHCAAGNNWFIQVVGKKRWYFMDPKYSSQMSPLRGGRLVSAVNYHIAKH